MVHSKEFFLSVFDLGDYPHTLLLSHDLKLYRKNEREPFGEIVTTVSGKTILRIGATFEDGIKVVV